MAAGSGVSINSARVDRILKTLQTNTSDVVLSGVMAGAIHQHLQRRMLKRFQTSGDSAVGDWQPLSEATKEIRVNLGFSSGARKGQINVRTGHMKKTLTEAKADIAITPVAVALSYPGNGIMDRPDMFHRTEQALGRRKGPARPTSGVDAVDVAAVLSALSRTIGRGVVTFGGSD